MSLWVSRDDATTWELPRRIWDGVYSGYSDLVPLATGDIGVLFEGINNGLRFLVVPRSYLDAPPPPATRPNQGFWNFSEFQVGQTVFPGVTNILNHSPTGALNCVPDQPLALEAGPVGFHPSIALGLNETGGLWLYPAQIGNPFDFGATDSFTIEAQLRIPPTETYGAIAAKDWGPQLPGWWVRVQEGGFVRFLVGDATGREVSVRSATKINDGNWHSIAAVRNATNRMLRVYLDGQLSAQAIDTTVGSLANGRPLAVGRFTATASAHLRADLNFLRIQPEALEPAQFASWPPVFIPPPPPPPDADGDGEPDAIEYAFGSDPQSAGVRPWFTAGITNLALGAGLQIDYHRLNDPAINAGLWLSEDLVHWTNSLPNVSLLSASEVMVGTNSATGFTISHWTKIFQDDRTQTNRSLFFRLVVWP